MNSIIKSNMNSIRIFLLRVISGNRAIVLGVKINFENKTISYRDCLYIAESSIDGACEIISEKRG